MVHYLSVNLIVMQFSTAQSNSLTEKFHFLQQLITTLSYENHVPIV